MTIEEAIARLLGNYGEPRDGSPEVLLAEYRRVMTGCAPDVIALGCDLIIDTETFWPRPAVVRKHLHAAASRIAVERERRDRKKLNEETFTGERDPRVGEMLSDLAKAMRADTTARAEAEPKTKPVPPVDRQKFEAMRTKSQNLFHRQEKRP